VRRWGVRNQAAGLYLNKTQGTPFYTPDLDRPGTRDEHFRSNSARVTWQATPKNKISGYYNNKKRDRGYYFGATPWTLAKEAAPHGYFFPFSAGPLVESAAMNASWGTSTRPTIFIRFLPSFCFSSSLRLRVMSPP